MKQKFHYFHDVQDFVYVDENNRNLSYMLLPAMIGSADLGYRPGRVQRFFERSDGFYVEHHVSGNYEQIMHGPDNSTVFNEIETGHVCVQRLSLSERVSAYLKWRPVISCGMESYCRREDYYGKAVYTFKLFTEDGPISYTKNVYDYSGDLRRLGLWLEAGFANHFNTQAARLDIYSRKTKPSKEDMMKLTDYQQYCQRCVNILAPQHQKIEYGSIAYILNNICSKYRLNITDTKMVSMTGYYPWLHMHKYAVPSYRVRVVPVFPVLLEDFMDRDTAIRDQLRQKFETASQMDRACAVARANYRRWLRTHLDKAEPSNIFPECDRNNKHIAMLCKVLVRPVSKDAIERGVDEIKSRPD